MSRLQTYLSKRKFDQTSEPKPKIISRRNETLRFCVQRHQARRLHYDLRLELDGVLISFAIPKGPSMDPKQKRLAVRTEDHPLEYLTFEGEIAPGNYGAGIVEIWDQGYYDANKAQMRKDLKAGHLHIVLHGKKLSGAFKLVKMAGPGENDWLIWKSHDEDKTAITALKKSRMPQWISPMLASVAENAFDSEDWSFEIKWDGYRALAFITKTKVQLWSRNHKSLNRDFLPVVNELKQIKVSAIMDGEIVALDEQGVSRFELLQGCSEDPNCQVQYMIFDLLFIDGRDIRALSLSARRELLKALFADYQFKVLQLSTHLDTRGIDLFNAAKKFDLEGLIAKRNNSLYQSTRSRDWVKIKTSRSQDFIIVGFTEPKGNRRHFGSLLLADNHHGQLRFVGHVGSGFSSNTINELYQVMKPLIRKTCPITTTPKTNGPATWIKPQLIAEISFAEITQQGSLRQPVFHRLRHDKAPQEIVTEIPAKNIRLNTNLTNPDKLFWPEEGYTKADMLAYYKAVSKYMLPHLKNRPLTLRRFPDGITGADFFQKNIQGAPSWFATANFPHRQHKNRDEDHKPLANNLRSLLYVANLAAIELHAALSRKDSIESADFMVIDLDPEAVSFADVIKVAIAAHELCDELMLPNYCKTSGGRGLHLYIPLGKNISFPQSQQLAQLLGIILRSRLPSLVSLERLPKRRQKRVYVDYLQNGKGKTMIAPYSLRALAHAPVSTPLSWEEIKTGNIDPLDFTMATVIARLEKTGDIFAPVLKQKINLKQVLSLIEQLLES